MSSKDTRMTILTKYFFFNHHFYFYKKSKTVELLLWVPNNLLDDKNKAK